MCSQALVFIVCANSIPMAIFDTMEKARESVRLQAEHMKLNYHLNDTIYHVQGYIGNVHIVIQEITQGPHAVGRMW